MERDRRGEEKTSGIDRAIEEVASRRREKERGRRKSRGRREKEISDIDERTRGGGGGIENSDGHREY